MGYRITRQDQQVVRDASVAFAGILEYAHQNPAFAEMLRHVKVPGGRPVEQFASETEQLAVRMLQARSALMSIFFTRLEAMSHERLLAEREYWGAIEEDHTWSDTGRAVARDFRIGCDAVLARRFPEGSVIQPGTAAPDTPDLPSDPPNGIIIGPVSLRPHRVPVLGADPASGDETR